MGIGQEMDGPAAELRNLLQPFLNQAKWPTSAAKQARDRATNDINTSLAEMRAASNGVRRLRSGEDQRAISEFQHAADDIVERVRKVADSAAPKEASADARADACIA